MKNLLITILFLLTKGFAYGQETEIKNVWDKANQAYENKQYAFAISHYEQLLGKEKKSADVYFNLGNAYYRNHQNGKAILNYLRALHLKPNMSAARENIKFIQSQSSKIITEQNDLFLIKIYHSILHAFSPNFWAWLAAICLIGSSIVFYLKLSKKIRKRPNRWLALSLGLSALFFAFAILSFVNAAKTNLAVVMQNNTFLYDNAKKSKVKWNLPEGTIVNIKQNLETGLVKVSLENGIEGWMEQSYIEKI